MNEHLQAAFLRGFERGLEKDAALVQAGLTALRLGGRALGSFASKAGSWATTYKGTGIPSSITSRVKPLASRVMGGIKSEAPRMAADVTSQAAMGKVFEQKPKREGAPQGSMFQPGQRSFT